MITETTTTQAEATTSDTRMAEQPKALALKRLRLILPRSEARRLAVQAAREEVSTKTVAARAVTFYLDHCEKQAP